MAIRACLRMSSFAIDSMGVSHSASVDGPVGEGSRAMRSSISEMDCRTARR